MKHSYLETWDEMTARHKRERIKQVMTFASDYTQTEAAKILGITHRHLNNFIQRNRLHWKLKYQR
ncbi:MAG TPA: hypothetical protein DC015_03940, partial [Aequorivita sp.]|nr:hypothetical protein [Aequorivita sp.]